MAIQAKRFIVAAALSLSTVAYAADVTVFVNGASGPWDIAANPTFPYANIACCGGLDIHLGPTSVSNPSLPFVVGDSLTIQYVSGLADAGGAHELSDANGRTWWPADAGAPGQYIPGTNYLLELVGTFADSSGKIVGNPFTIGNSLVGLIIPTGATQLLMGFNDGWYTDNGSGLNMNVAEVASIPEPETYAMMLAGLGLLAFAARRRKQNDA